MQKNTRHKKFQEMAVKVHKNEISKNILKGTTEENERRQKIKNLQKNSAAKKTTKAIKSGVGKIKANKPLSDSTVNFLEESESESDTEKAEGKPEGKKKRKTKNEKETEYKNISSSLTANMLEDAIAIIDTEIKDYEKEDKTNVLHKDGSDDLNKKLSVYGLKFKTGTKVATVIKKLENHKTRLKNEHGVGNLVGRLTDLKTSQEKAKKAESIDI